MGCCSSSDAGVQPPTEGTEQQQCPPFSPSTDLFLELGVALSSRPTPGQLHDKWYEHFDVDHNDVLTVEECRSYFEDISKTWGDGSWVAAASSASGMGRRSKPSSTLLLLTKDTIKWEEVRSALWDRPVFGIPSPTVLLFQRAFLRRCAAASKDGTADQKTLTQVDASKLSRQMLGSVRTPKDRAAAAAKTLLTKGNSSSENKGVTLEIFLREIGPIYVEFAPSHDAFAGLDDEPGDLPLDGKIRSFAPVRSSTPVEILNCGEAIISAMLHAIEGATTEIMMSFWEFCPDLPAVRNANLGSDAWTDPGGTLPPILKAKAERGVKVYIMLWDIIDVVMPTAPLVERAIEMLGKLHPNISVVSHPGLNVWTHTHHQKFVVADRKVAILGGLDWALKRWDTPSHPLFDPDSAVHPGVDLFPEGMPNGANVKAYFEDPQRDIVAGRSETAAQPWQDISVWVKGDAAADVALNFIQRWNHARADTIEVFGDGLRNDMPEIPLQNFRYLTRPSPDVEAVDDSVRSSLTPGGLAPPSVAGRECRCQIVRSLGRWSGGLSLSEISHYEAWISAINSAEEYIYIEQQYFVANVGEAAAKNRVAEAILQRAQRAVNLSKPFRIYIVVPATVEVETVNYFTRRTLLQDGKDKDEMSLMSRIQWLLNQAKPGSYWDGATAESMLSVCTLYSVDKSASGRWDVAEIFVHSKVILVDDRVAVIGSANANDRSWVGYSDSEIGAILWDEDSTGVVRDFRMRLWRQFLALPMHGATDDLVSDPSSEGAFDLWTEAAADNLNLLSSVTGFTLRDSITSFSQYKSLADEYTKKSPQEKASDLIEPGRLEGMQGQIVRYPANFLSDQQKKSMITKFTESFPLTKQAFL